MIIAPLNGDGNYDCFDFHDNQDNIYDDSSNYDDNQDDNKVFWCNCLSSCPPTLLHFFTILMIIAKLIMIMVMAIMILKVVIIATLS